MYLSETDGQRIVFVLLTPFSIIPDVWSLSVGSVWYK